MFARAIADQAWLATLTAAWIVGLELTAPLWLAMRRTRLWFLAAVTVLHVGTWLTLGLDYWAWILTVATLTVPWDELPLSSAAPVGGPSRRRLAVGRR